MNREPEFLSLRKTHRPKPRGCHCEPLECRIALSAVAESGLADLNFDYETLLQFERAAGEQFPGGVSVSDHRIFTHQEVIPRFVAEPTITNIRSGNWSDPSAWSPGRVPTNGDRVAIARDTILLYSEVSDARIDGLEISGALVFSPFVDTRLVVADLTVMPTGRLQIGSATAPVAADVRAELVIADQPIDTELDPKQFGTGLIALGEVTIHGAELEQTWVRLAAEPRAGDDSLLLAGEAPDWRAGDRLVLPDSRQTLTSDEHNFMTGQLAPQWEELIVSRVEGNRVFLTENLAFDHPGARNVDGALELLPHVAMLDRNVVIRSENPTGTRGHLMFTARADVDVKFAGFQDLGRTDAMRDLDNTEIDPKTGKVTHLGTNQVGRYAVHLHHLMGPENPNNVGYQFQLVGNSVEHSRKWAVTVHGASFGLVSDNVVYDAQGAGIVTEDGSEIGNLFRNNITIRMQGTHDDGKSGTAEGDYGRGGSGFWFRRGGNLVVGNVAADSTYAGFVFDGYFTDEVVLPLVRGAAKHKPGQGVTTRLNPATLLADNEVYGMSKHGVWMAFVAGNNHLSNQPLTRISDLRLWHVWSDGIEAYHTARLSFDRLLILGDRAAQDRNDTGTVGLDLATYENFDLTIRNSRIEGLRLGIVAPRNDSTQAGVEKPTLIRNSTLKNYINVVVSPSRDNRPTHGNVLELRDVRFELVDELPPGPAQPDSVPPPANIHMSTAGEDINWTHKSIVRVYNYNQVPGDDFQVFYREQRSTFVLPQTDPALLAGGTPGEIGSPRAGLTNSQNWTQFGLAMAGMVAPASATDSRGEINGLTGPILNLAALTPRVVLVTPWNTAVVRGSDEVRIRYNVNGSLPDGAQVYFQFDGGEPFTELKNGSILGVSPGLHSLSAYIGDASGTIVPGTSAVTHWFLVRL